MFGDPDLVYCWGPLAVEENNGLVDLTYLVTDEHYNMRGQDNSTEATAQHHDCRTERGMYACMSPPW